MSRYRQTGLNGNYALQLSTFIEEDMSIAFAIPLRIYEKLHGKSESVIAREVIESIRLIADETAGGVVLCSTGLKAKVKHVSLTNTTIPIVTLLLDYPTDAVKTAVGTESGVKWVTYTITKYGITTTYTLRESDQMTIEMDWGEGPDDTYEAIDKTLEYIAGGRVAFDCGDAIISSDYDINSRVTNEDGILIGGGLNVSIPENFGVGHIVKAGNLGTNTYKVPKSVENPTLMYNGSNYFISGVTEWITLQSEKAYICTAVESLIGAPNHHVYVYSEASDVTGRSTKEVYEKVKNIDLSPLAKEAQAILNKNEIKQHVRNTAGDCIFPDFEWPCLPFDKPNGYSALDNDLDIYTGDFDPQMGSEAAKLFVGAIIKVTGDCDIEDETYGFPAGTSLSVAKAVSSDQAGYEQGLYWNFQENSELAGVTQTIQPQKDHYYRVTGFHDVYDMTNHETVEGYVITYEEVDPQSISDLVKRAAEKLLSEYRESAGSMIIATSAEYAAFKSHMQTQIANILTPITESNNE